MPSADFCLITESLLTSALCWIVSGLIYARFVEKRYAITRTKILYSLLSGCLVYGIVRTLLAALALGPILGVGVAFLTELLDDMGQPAGGP